MVCIVFIKNTDNNINIIFVHGWRADNLNRLEKVFLDSFIKRSYNVYSYVLPFHMERSPKHSLYSGEYFISANVVRTLKSIQQSVSDIRALINYIKTVKKGKVIIMGLSLGGYVLNKDTDILWKSWGKPQRELYSCGHSGIVLCKNKIKRDVLKFIDMRV